MRRVGFFLCICVCFMLLKSQVVFAESQSFSDVGKEHWAKADIDYLIELGIIKGFSDKTFQPNRNVTNVQVARMVARALSLETINRPHPGFVDVNEKSNGFLEISAVVDEGIFPKGDSFQPNKPMSRDMMARVLVKAFSLQGASESVFPDVPPSHPAYDSVTTLVHHDITRGFPDGTFRPDEPLTRAQFCSFLARALRIEAVGEFQFRGVSLYENVSEILVKLGEPNRIDIDPKGFRWFIYNANLSNYLQVGIQDGKVIAIYTGADNWKSKSGIKIGTPRQEAKAKLKFTRNMYVANQFDNVEIFEMGQFQARLYYDFYQQHQVTSVLLIDHEIAAAPSNWDEEVIKGMQRQVQDLTNISRNRHGQYTLNWSYLAYLSAINHSKDMATRQFFGHRTPEGITLLQRMRATGALFSLAGENIYLGPNNAIEAHQGWMNSEGHRKNILDPRFQFLGVGIFQGAKGIYYTQNFFAM